jgi:hypothetical protein
MKALLDVISGNRRTRRGISPSTAAAPPTTGDSARLREEILERGLSAERARALAEVLETEGQLRAAVDMFTHANRLCRDAALERHLVRLRRAAFAEIDRSLPPPAWPPFAPQDQNGQSSHPPEVAAAALTPGVLRNGILRHGSVLVRGLVPPQRVARLRHVIERAFAAYDATIDGRASADMAEWFDPVEDIPDGDLVRSWGRTGQGVFAADSPRALFELLETVREIGLDELIGAYFGERPALSVEKTTLRLVDTATQHPEWHQDGAFLGDGVRTVNAWFALSRCGRDAPGLDVIPQRLERVFATGTTGTAETFFDWVVSAETIMRELPGVQVWRPEFEAGDVLLFDHVTLHRTANSPAMPNVRYAIESWFFAPSVYPARGSTPIIV